MFCSSVEYIHISHVHLSFLRAKSKVNLICLDSHLLNQDPVICLGVDGKTDQKTFVKEKVEVDGVVKIKQSQIPEHHMTFIDANTCKYLSHKSLESTNAKAMSSATIEVLEEFSSTESLKAMLVDNTSSNIGWKGGLVVKVEKALKKKLHTIGCMLHFNELPFRKIFQKIDGTTTGPVSFKGDLGERAAIFCPSWPIVRFQPIPNLVASILDVSSTDLSNDQRLLFEYCKGISDGFVSEPWVHRKIGPVNHARWLTLAVRLLALYTRTTSPSMGLVQLASFICRVYAPTWFKVKQSGSLKDIPKLIFDIQHDINLYRLENFLDDFREVVQRSCFAFLYENFLYALIMSEDKSTQIKGWEFIKQMRLMPPAPNDLRKKIPRINWHSSVWSSMIDLTEGSYNFEPPIVNSISIEEIEHFCNNGTTCHITNFPCHSQSVERAVKLVSEASKMVYGEENRHQVILTILRSRNLRPSFDSIGSYVNSYDDFFNV